MIDTVTLAGPEDVDKAVQSAKSAFPAVGDCDAGRALDGDDQVRWNP